MATADPPRWVFRILDAPSVRLQVRTLPSVPADSSSWPYGEYDSEFTAPRCPRSTCGCPPLTGQSRIALSKLAEASWLPSGEKARAETALPWRSTRLARLLRFQSRIVESRLPLASISPSGEIRTCSTASSCPRRSTLGRIPASQTRTVL